MNARAERLYGGDDFVMPRPCFVTLARRRYRHEHGMAAARFLIISGVMMGATRYRR